MLKDKKNATIIVESALLGSGLVGMTDEEIDGLWQVPDDTAIMWLENGEFVIGDLEEFLPYRNREDWQRYDEGDAFRLKKGTAANAYLTASAVLSLCGAFGSHIVVTAGMGGVSANRVSGDLAALANHDALLVATAPKDMMDYAATFGILAGNSVGVMGYGRALSDGFMFMHLPSAVNLYASETVDSLLEGRNRLLLNAIPKAERLKNIEWLEAAVTEGNKAIEQKQSHHPVINAALAKASGGLTNTLQVKALVRNINLAYELAAKG
ncbi:MAG: pseudouridine-5'-phosphate glycosidase [Clostridia bacterium]|nr:pseudouridine-5'-phosphate glycosidase [Clostridia bacterium]